MTKKISKHKWNHILIAVLAICVCVTGGIYGYTALKGNTVYISGTIVERDLNDLMEKSCLVAEGTVIDSSESFQIKSSTGAIANYTDYNFKISDQLRGETEATEVTIRVQGGTVDEYTEIYEDSPSLEVGDTYLVFLYKPGRGGAFNTDGDYYYVLGLTQGIFTENSDGDYISQSGVTVSTYELQKELTSVNDLSIDELYFRNEYIENQKRNIETGFITQEEYDTLMENIDNYATIVK